MKKMMMAGLLFAAGAAMPCVAAFEDGAAINLSAP